MWKIFNKFLNKLKRPSRTEKWDKRDKGFFGAAYIPFFSKRGIPILILTYLGIIHLIQIVSWLVGELIYNTSKLGYIPAN